MARQARQLRLAYLRRGWQILLCVGTVLLVATPALADTMNNYYTWCWNGFSASSPPPVSGNPLPSDLGGTASLSGYVFFDVNPSDGNMNKSDWAIPGAEVVLTQAGSTAALATAYTGNDGSYSFTTLPAAGYTITLDIPNSQPGQNYLGLLQDQDGNFVSTGQGTITSNGFAGIQLGAGYTGTFYDFAQLAYPVSLLSLRSVLNTSPGPLHTVPEPGSLVLLAMAGLVFGGLTWRRAQVHS